MRKRTKAREIALKILYAWEMSKESIEETADKFWQDSEEDPQVSGFCKVLVSGVSEHLGSLDEVISKYATNWRIERMAVIDRNILRLATYELLYAEEVPPKVSINEAINIAKKFGSKDSGKFVNGILDRIHKMEINEEEEKK